MTTRTQTVATEPLAQPEEQENDGENVERAESQVERHGPTQATARIAHSSAAVCQQQWDDQNGDRE